MRKSNVLFMIFFQENHLVYSVDLPFLIFRTNVYFNFEPKYIVALASSFVGKIPV